ncbi:MAG: patatin-like phospholipase family protein [Clostridiales bacterium]|jgi:NTE family protein|nr:patatin-like phospholipase family protein [Clostridiales bacterium]
MGEKKCRGVFEGGGVKGIGLVGAVAGIEDNGYEFENVAGTSAGAIVASLIAVGYTAAEIKEEMMKINFANFSKSDFLARLGFVGIALKFATKNGVYKADYLEEWLEGLYAKKGKSRFRDLRIEDATSERYRYRFQAVASDLSDSSILVLPGDLKKFGIDPDSYRIAKAVRMSMSIPVYYEPFILTDADGRKHVVVDGGLLSNYPIWLLDDKRGKSRIPTIGFKFVSSEAVTGVDPLTVDHKKVHSMSGFTLALIRTALDAHDKHYVSVKGDYQRTIAISPHIVLGDKNETISTVQFDITDPEKEALYQNGYNAAKSFLSTWDFEEWQNNHQRD